MPLRHVATVTNSNVDKVIDDTEIPVRLCNYVDVYKNDFIDADLEFSAGTATKVEIESFGLRMGDVIITKDSEDRLDIGVPAYVRSTADDLVCGYHLSLLRAKHDVMRGDFLFWALQTVQSKAHFSNSAYGITRYGLSLRGIKSLALNCPDLAVQKTIADFLDRETARIDRLIEKKERLVELAAQKRASVITLAVAGKIDPKTGKLRRPVGDAAHDRSAGDHKSEGDGVSPAPELKMQSRTEGAENGNRRALEGGLGVSDQLESARLQRANRDWTVLRLKHLASVSGGGTPSKDNAAFWENGSIPWVSPKDMKCRIISETEDYITNDAVKGSATSFVETNSPLMVVRSGILRSVLPVAIAGRRLTINQDMKAFKLSPRLNPHFFVYWIEGQSDDLLPEWRQLGATVESIDVDRMMNGKLAVPDLETQESIVSFLDRETAALDKLSEAVLASIDLLRKYRSALITAAVTGATGIVDMRGTAAKPERSLP